MRYYSVHQPAASAQSTDATIFVKEGFSWPAFFFSFLWMLWHRLWIEFVAFIVIMVTMQLMLNALGLEAIGGAVSFLVNLLLGLEGNQLLRHKLVRNGYVEVGTVAAEDRGQAELKYFGLKHRDPSTAAIAAPT
jgi:hypothetical protein